MKKSAIGTKLLPAGILISTLAGCQFVPRSPLEYSQTAMDPETASKTIVQALMEQPAQFRPGGVSFEPEYIEIDYGEVTKAHHTANLISVNSSTSAKKQITRVYYSSIAKMDVVPRKSLFVARINNDSGSVSLRLYMATKQRAFAVLDAINALRKAAPK